MKRNKLISILSPKWSVVLMALLVFACMSTLQAQEQEVENDTAATKEVKSKPIRGTFGASWLIDNQSVDVPVKGTFAFDIVHRFGVVENGGKDMFGLYAPSNIRLALNYSPIEKLYIGAGMTKYNMLVDLNVKYALLQQTRDNSIPLSISYFGNIAMDTRDGSNFRYDAHRFSYFNQLLFARKFSDAFSAQVGPSFSWFNNVEGYISTDGSIKGKMNNYHVAISVLGRYKISEKFALLANYDQPLTQHAANNPHPNIAFGIELSTSSHAFQIFAGNYYNIVPQYNNMYNQNDFRDGQFLIGFNINRLWNF